MQSKKDKLKSIIENDEYINQFIQQSKNEKIAKQQQSIPIQVTCPKCGSTQIQMVARKWSLLTGFFTSKVDRVCVNCKHKF